MSRDNLIDTEIDPTRLSIKDAVEVIVNSKAFEKIQEEITQTGFAEKTAAEVKAYLESVIAQLGEATPQLAQALQTLSQASAQNPQDALRLLQVAASARSEAAAAEAAQLLKTLGGSALGAAVVVGTTAHQFADLLAQNPKTTAGLKGLLGEEGAKVLNQTHDALGQLYEDVGKAVQQNLQSLGVK